MDNKTRVVIVILILLVLVSIFRLYRRSFVTEDFQIVDDTATVPE